MKNKKPIWLLTLSIFSVIFGFLTIFAGGNALFTETGKLAAGKIISLVLWYNFIAGFFYIITGLAIYRQKSIAVRLSMLLANSAFAIYFALIMHILEGKEYEMRTLYAMTFRTVYWITVAIIVFKSKHIEKVECNC